MILGISGEEREVVCWLVPDGVCWLRGVFAVCWLVPGTVCWLVHVFLHVVGVDATVHVPGLLRAKELLHLRVNRARVVCFTATAACNRRIAYGKVRPRGTHKTHLGVHVARRAVAVAHVRGRRQCFWSAVQ